MSKQQLDTIVCHVINGRPQEAAAILDEAVAWDLGTLSLALLAGSVCSVTQNSYVKRFV